MAIHLQFKYFCRKETQKTPQHPLSHAVLHIYISYVAGACPVFLTQHIERNKREKQINIEVKL